MDSVKNDLPLEDIRERRKRLNRKLSEVAEKAGIATSTLSSIETNKLGKVNDEIYAKIIQALDELEELDRSTSANNQAKLTIGFGHCLWAAPFILLLQNSEQLVGLEAYSFGEIDDEEQIKPFKIRESKDISRIPGPANDEGFELRSRRPSFRSNKLGEENYDHVIDNQEYPNLRALTAPQLIDDFEIGKNNTLIIPPIVLDNYNRDKYLKVASLVYSSSGGTQLSIFCKKNQIGSSNDLSLYQWLSELMDANKSMESESLNKIVILYPPKTICEQHYKGPFRHFLAHWKHLIVDEEEIENLANYNETADQVIYWIEHEYIVFLLAWHPLTYWIEHKVRHKQPMYNAITPLNYDLIQEMDNISKPIVFEFALVIDKEKFMNKLYDLDMIKELLENLFYNIRQLNNDIDKIKLILLSLSNTKERVPESLIPDRIKRVANYLRMKPQDCAEALVKISFYLSIHPDFYFHNNPLKS